MHVAHNIETKSCPLGEIGRNRQIVRTNPINCDFLSHPIRFHCAFCGTAPRLYLPTAIVKGLVIWLPTKTHKRITFLISYQAKSVSGQLKGDTCDLLKVLAAQRAGHLRRKSWDLPAAKWRLLGSTVYRASGGLWTRSPYFHGCGPKV
jgi:hypothetical protein